MKDVPTLLPIGITQSAVLQRANTADILVHKGLGFLNSEGVIATGSLRRKAQWLHRYPQHKVVDLRGNVNLRLQKLKDSNWEGAIFAKAGLERIKVLPENYIDLGWMVPAPAQGAVVVHTMKKDVFTTEAVSKLNDKATDMCTAIERSFLRKLEGGCTAPIGALATIINNKITFEGVLFSLDGSQKVVVKYDNIELSEAKNLGVLCAQEVLSKGGDVLMKEIKTVFK
jgi:hydroxymethylbilane synthase